MKMVALQDVPSQCGVIEAGSIYIELDEWRAEDCIARKVAKKYEEEIPALLQPKRSSITLDWPDSTVVIMASGSSLTLSDAARVKEWRNAAPVTRKVIVINTTYQMAPFADILYACDGVWWTAQHKGESHFLKASRHFTPAQMWTQDRATARQLGIQSVTGEYAPGLSKKRDTIALGYNSGYQAIGLAVLAGAKKIILLGYDMQGTSWHKEHHAPLNQRRSFKLWLEQFPQLAADLKARGIEVVNCSRSTALKTFRLADLEEELA